MSTERPLDIGSRLELLVDDYLISELSGPVKLRLHHPTPKGVALVCDQPWEGNLCGYVTVFQDEGRYRMYYRGAAVDLEAETSEGERLHRVHASLIAQAESDDGVNWIRPELGLIEFEGSRANNVVFTGAGPEQPGIEGFSPFRDPNPGCAPEAAYKATVAAGGWPCPGLMALQSPDGLRWSVMQETPVITEGKFDSQNLAFWDSVRGEYRVYVRDFQEGRRCIRTATSRDFLNWTEPKWLEYPGAPPEQLYTNQVIPYYRAPHLFLGFPTRYVDREWSPTMDALPDLEHRKLRAGVNRRFGTALTDGLFMTSRDGRTFRRWGEAFLRPGLRLTGNWTYGDCYQSWGLVETDSDVEGAPRELSFYASETYWQGATRFRRYTLRIDGFVSLHAPLSGGEFLSHPLTFTGDRLVLNCSTSAAGHLRVELQDGQGKPFAGYGLEDCDEVVGDFLGRTVTWKGESSLGDLAEAPVRLRIVLSDADLYSLRFA